MDKIFISHARIPARLRGGGVLAAGLAVAVLATGGVAVASDSATGSAAATGTIRGCFQPGSATAPLQVVTRAHASCPTGDKRLTWNTVGPQGPQGDPGPQGPAGLSTGVTTGKVATVPIDNGPNTPVTVLTAPPVPTTGTYYIAATMTLQVAAGDAAACAAVPNQEEAQTAQIGPDAAVTVTPMTLTGALFVNAGQTPSVICIDAASNSSTEMLQGSMNVTLINSSTVGGSARPRGGRFPLRILGTK